MMSSNRGILIMALGHPNYGKMALQLAISIKNTCKIPVALAYTESAIAHLHRFNIHSYFDHLIPMPVEAYETTKTEFIRAKLWMYELSPFDETIFLDADTIMFPSRSLEDMFNELHNAPLAIQNRGKIDLSADKVEGSVPWVNVNDVKQMYQFKTGWYYKIHSEFVYFKKNELNEKTFAEAIYLYDNLEVEVKKPFAGGVPDELPLSIAMIMHHNYPHAAPFTPIYWEALDKTKYQELHQLYADYYMYSIGGNVLSTQIIDRYTRLAKWHSNKAGINRQVYFYQHKKNWAIERINI